MSKHHDTRNTDCPWNDPETVASIVRASMDCTCPPKGNLCRWFLQELASLQSIGVDAFDEADDLQEVEDARRWFVSVQGRLKSLYSSGSFLAAANPPCEMGTVIKRFDEAVSAICASMLEAELRHARPSDNSMSSTMNVEEGRLR